MTLFALTPPTNPYSGLLRTQHLQLALTVDFAPRSLAGTTSWLLAGAPAPALAELVLGTYGLLLAAMQPGDAANGPATNQHLAPTNPVLGRSIAHPGTAKMHITYRTSLKLPPSK